MYEEQYGTLQGCVLFLANIKLLKLLKVNQRMARLLMVGCSGVHIVISMTYY